MKTHIIKFIALIAFIAGVFSCSDKEEQQLQMTNSELNSESSDNRISSLAGDTLMTSFDVDGLVDMTVEVRNINDKETVTAITLKMDEGVDVTSLAPTITLAPGASIKPESGTVQDFSQYVVYAVITEDGTRSIYLVISENGPETRAKRNITISATVGGAVTAIVKDEVTAMTSSYTAYAGGSQVVPTNDVFETTFQVYALESNYCLDGWYLNNGATPISTELEFYDILSFNAVLQARYVLKQHTVTVQSENTNRGTVSGGGLVDDRGAVTITASPKSGFIFEGWYKNGIKQNNMSATHNFRPDANVTLQAKFNMNPSSVTITGATNVCVGSNTTFAVSAPGAVTWNKSSNISISGSGTSVSVSGTSNGSGWVSVIDNFNNKEVKRLSVWVGPPPAVNLNCESGYYFAAGYYTDWYLDYLPPGSVSNISWSYYGVDGATAQIIVQPLFQSGAMILFNDPGRYSVYATLTNACGSTTVYKDLEVY